MNPNCFSGDLNPCKDYTESQLSSHCCWCSARGCDMCQERAGTTYIAFSVGTRLWVKTNGTILG